MKERLVGATGYALETAGHQMTRFVPVATEDLTLQQVHDALKAKSREYKTMNYIYVLDAQKKLVGTLSIRDIFREKADVKVGDVCKRSPLVFVHPSSHQERAAYLALQHNIKAIPVVESDRTFLGEITADSILSILHKEMHEDTLRRAGIRHPDAMHATVLQLPVLLSVRHRIPWLLLGLIGGLVAAKVVGLFEQILRDNLILAAFIPLIVYMSDAVGTQMEAYIIRDLSFDRSLPFVKYFLRHLFVVCIVGAFLALLLTGSYGVLYRQWYLGLVLGASLFASVISSVFTGLVIPYFFSRIRLDPADASGPVATILQDMISIIIYFSIATALL